MRPLRKLADRLTGQEAARAAEIERRRCDKLRASDHDNHLREIQQLRLAALGQGAMLYKQPEDWVDISTLDGPKWEVATWSWQADPIHESNVEAARDVIIGETRRKAR